MASCSPLGSSPAEAEDVAEPRYRNEVMRRRTLPVATAPAGTPAGVATAPKQATSPRPRREQQQATESGWGWFGRQRPYETRPQESRGFFGGWFGGGRW